MPRATKNLMGERFGRLTVIERNYDKENDTKLRTGHGRTFWNCICDCGCMTTVAAAELLSGNTQSCGCLQRDRTKRPFIDLTGKRFGMLTVIKIADGDESSASRDRKWLCRCDCGKEVVRAERYLLQGGKVYSCGCYVIKHAQELGYKNKKYNTYDLSGDFGIGYTSLGDQFYFDLEDYNKIKNYCWYLDDYGYIETTIYIDKNTSHTLKMHRLIMDVLDNDEVVVDHIGHSTVDNRKSQLRVCTQGNNTYNTVKKYTNTSGFKGISWDKDRCKWHVQIGVNNKNIHLGRYDNLEDAIIARKIAEEKYHGSYSYDNSMIYASQYRIKEEASAPDVEEAEELISESDQSDEEHDNN